MKGGLDDNLVSGPTREPSAAGFDKKPRIAFLIRSLNRGGAERQLAELAIHLAERSFDIEVVTFYTGGPVADELKAAGISVRSLEKKGRWDLWACAWRLVTIVRSRRPAILHCYLVEPSLVGLLVGRLTSVPVVIWGVRASNVDYSSYERTIGAAFKISVWLSRFADSVVANSEAGRRHHLACGYASRRFEVIANGIDSDRFKPCAEARLRVRARWNIGPDELLIGIAARLDPMKGHDTLLRALRDVVKIDPSVRLACVGDGPLAYAERLRSLAAELDIEERIVWTGSQEDMTTIYPAFDIGCSSSRFGEGFSNAIGEAMACGVPCVVTDVGDSAAIVGETGLVVPPGQPLALGEALLKMSRMEDSARRRLGEQARLRMIRSYGVAAMVTKTVALYDDLLQSQFDR